MGRGSNTISGQQPLLFGPRLPRRLKDPWLTIRPETDPIIGAELACILDDINHGEFEQALALLDAHRHQITAPALRTIYTALIERMLGHYQRLLRYNIQVELQHQGVREQTALLVVAPDQQLHLRHNRDDLTTLCQQPLTDAWTSSARRGLWQRRDIARYQLSHCPECDTQSTHHPAAQESTNFTRLDADEQAALKQRYARWFECMFRRLLSEGSLSPDHPDNHYRPTLATPISYAALTGIDDLVDSYAAKLHNQETI